MIYPMVPFRVYFGTRSTRKKWRRLEIYAYGDG